MALKPGPYRTAELKDDTCKRLTADILTLSPSCVFGGGGASNSAVYPGSTPSADRAGHGPLLLNHPSHERATVVQAWNGYTLWHSWPFSNLSLHIRKCKLHKTCLGSYSSERAMSSVRPWWAKSMLPGLGKSKLLSFQIGLDD